MFQANLTQMNKSGANGTVSVQLNGDQVKVTEHVSGVVPGMAHAQHLHFSKTSTHTCPAPSADKNNDGIVSTLEGAGAYGGVKASLTKSGDTSPKAALALKQFPTAKNGTIDYSRTIKVSDSLAQAIQKGQVAVVVHGIDVNGNGKYDTDAGTSPLAKQLAGMKNFPLEGTAPAACGVLTAANTTNNTASTDNSNQNMGNTANTSSNNNNGSVAVDVALGLGSLGVLLSIISLAMAGKGRKS
jgi:hypothetical protein